MKYNDRTMVARAPVIVDYGAFQQPPSRLFRDYLHCAAEVRSFYGPHCWDLDGIAAAAEDALELPRRRDALVDALARQQEARGAADAAAGARRLAHPRAAAVVTGQQAVLFGGPLFVLYKALAAVKVAAALEERRGAPVVPVFWVAADDHDFAEIRTVSVLDDAGDIRNLRYAPKHEPVGQPAAQIVIDETIHELLEELRQVLPSAPHRDAALQRIAAAYRPGATFSSAFAAMVAAIVPGLVVLDPADPALKALAAPVFRREIEETSPTSRLAAEAGKRLLASGYHQQVPVRPGFLNLFVMMEGERRALGWADGFVEVRGLGRRVPVAEMLARLEAEPWAFSAGVLLRPLSQDLLLPTAAYVGGPAEVAYHAQIGPSYPHFGIPRSPVLPRPSVTVVEPGQARALEAEGLSLPDLQADPQGMLARWTREAYPEVQRAFERTRQAIEKEMAAVEDVLGALDPTLRGAASSARGRALHQVEGLEEKATRALKKRDQARADRLRRTRDALMPGGAFQERGLGIAHLLARHGEAVVAEIGARLDPWARGHQVIAL
jgi:bacillithiol biosynthesis cysteine-adding enzyme BshC